MSGNNRIELLKIFSHIEKKFRIIIFIAFVIFLTFFAINVASLLPFETISSLGEIAVLIGQMAFVLSLITAFLSTIFAIANYAFRRSKGNELIIWLWLVVVSVTMFLGIYLGGHWGHKLRGHYMERGIEAGQPIIAALEKYRRDNGSYPQSLASLVPKYLLQIPKTGLSICPDFEYKNLEKSNIEYFSDYFETGGYELKFGASIVTGLELFLYWPSRNYPMAVAGYDSEKKGDWFHMIVFS